MEARSLLQSQNASDLVFLHLEIRLGKANEGNQKRAVESRKNVVFTHPGIRLRKVEGRSKKVQKRSKEKVNFFISEVQGWKAEVENAEKG